MFRIALLESQTTIELPHMGMCLMHADLVSRRDVEVRSGRVFLGKLGAGLDFIEEGRFDLVAMDCRFPVDFPGRVKERLPGAQVVVGGLGFYNMLTKGRADFAVMGPGRRSLARLVDVLAGGGDDFSGVPNLFHWVDRPATGQGPGGGPIDYSGADAGYDLEAEIEPFDPDFEFPLFGFDEREEEERWRQVAPPAIVAEFGCPHKGYRLGSGFPEPRLRPEEATFTDRALARLQAYMDERWRGGCSFCVYQNAPVSSVADTVDSLMAQTGRLHASGGFTSFAIQSEAPFRFLVPYLERLAASDIPVQDVFIRGRSALFQRKRDILERAVSLAREAGFRLVSWQIGYENFCERQLELYNKGTSVEENLGTVRLIRDLSTRHPDHFLDLNITHGMIIFNPWTTFDEVKSNFDVIRRHLPERLVQSPVMASELELFDPFLPIYQKALAEGLVIPEGTGADRFRMADPAMEVVRGVLKRVLTRIHELLPSAVLMEVGLLAPVVGELLEAVLAELERRYFSEGSRREPVNTDAESEEIAAGFYPRFHDVLTGRVNFIHAVKEILFFAPGAFKPETLDAERGRPAPSVDELESAIAEVGRAYAGLDGEWDLDFVPIKDKVVVHDRRTGDQTPMDRVLLSFIQIAFHRMDVEGILRAAISHTPVPPGLILKRAREALAFLEGCRVG